MTPQPEPVLFEAVCRPHASLGPRGTRLVAGLVLGGSALVDAMVAALGAWPVLGFTGAEVALILCLLALHRRASRRAMEIVRLTGGRLTVRRHGARGRPVELVLDPYWARLSLEERPGRVSALLLRQRRRTVEIATLLGEEQKRDLAAALGEALRRYREPEFDNPQLREGWEPPPGR
ncbi:MAG TPA: DUF2244 domain-containing protein [Crenalkalicoccus sp.]|nr:DUF2244 domain-containing protein [Crenalkalicoccus sp.]